jgi:3-deoxy-D-manno-octulosonic-acid transferase
LQVEHGLPERIVDPFRDTSKATLGAMPSSSRGYQAALRLALAAAPAAGWVSPRIRGAIQARRHAGQRLLEWSRTKRESHRPLAWFHASSVGEGLQAQSVLVAFRRLCPGCQVVYTHFSPSAEGLARRMEADVADYLPWDLTREMTLLLRALAPDLLVFVKLDVWPELSTRAADSGARVALVAGTVSPGSSRLRGPIRNVLRPGYRAMAAAAVIAEEDGRRLEQLGVLPERIRILGDPRCDSVAERVRGVSPDEPLLRFGRGAPTLVAGSTWPADEHVVLQAFQELRRERPDARLILAPHEPTSDSLARLERRATTVGLPPIRLSAADGPQTILLIDRVGVLATLYGTGTMAYVGGGFGRAGLHSVLEPAAWALPVTFGPRWQNSRDAALLLDAGGAVALPSRAMGSAAAALYAQWHRWIANEESRRAQGEAARQVVERGLGAAERSAGMLVELLRTPA